MKKTLNRKNYLVLTMFLLIIFIAWDFGYGPPFEASKIYSAKVAAFGQIGIFTYKKLIYKPAAGLSALPDGGIPLYITDKDYIAVYDFLSRKIRIIYQENNLKGRWVNGQGEFNIIAAYGKKALVSQGGQRRADLKNEIYYHWLDLNSGKLTILPLQQELASRGLEAGYLYLIDEEGTLVMVAPTLGSDSNWTRESNANKHLLIRHPSGDYEDIAQIVHYYGVKDKDVHYWSSDNKYVVYNFETKTDHPGKREGDPTVSTDPEKFLSVNNGLEIHYENSYILQACRKNENLWLCENVDLKGVFN